MAAPHVPLTRLMAGHAAAAAMAPPALLAWRAELRTAVERIAAVGATYDLARDVVVAYAHAECCVAEAPAHAVPLPRVHVDESEWAHRLAARADLLPLFGTAPALYHTMRAAVATAGKAATGKATAGAPPPAKRPRLCPAHAVVSRKTAARAAVTSLAVGSDRDRIVMALRLAAHFGTAPWANKFHRPNDAIMRRLMAGALPLIVGHADPVDPGDAMLLSADPDTALGENYVWITNRQQGKTTTMARLLAVLSLASPVGGSLLGCYSTKYERAAELVLDARRYVEWLQSPAGAHPDWPPGSIVFEKCTQQMYSVRTPYTPAGSPNEVKSRPTRANTCRGDYFKWSVFDEAAFTNPGFWYTFALPLLQNTGRRFVCATTPPQPGSFFDNFCARVKAQQAEGNRFFQLINHSLACADCIDKDAAADCCHNLHQIPEWKCVSAVMTHLKNLIGDSFTAEVFGVIGAKFRACLPKELVQAAFARKRIADVGKVDRIWIAIDPAYHSRSEMALVAAVGGPAGQLVIVGAASVPVHATEMIQIQGLVSEFCRRVRGVVGRGPAFVPIVECNASHVAARSILAAIEQNGPVEMPFVAERFRNHVVDQVGVLTTHATKEASVECTLQLLVETRLFVLRGIVSVDRTCFQTTAKPIPTRHMIDTLQTQLQLLTHTDKGEISGKGTDGQNDDLAMAFLMLVLWRSTYLRQLAHQGSAHRPRELV